MWDSLKRFMNIDIKETTYIEISEKAKPKNETDKNEALGLNIHDNFIKLKISWIYHSTIVLPANLA